MRKPCCSTVLACCCRCQANRGRIPSMKIRFSTSRKLGDSLKHGTFKERKMTESTRNCAILRLAVGLLGQRAGHRWWDCDFLSPAGLDSLEYNFARSPFTAAFSATCMAAKRLHDDRIGRTGVTHLFRFQPDLEIMVQKAASSEGNDFPKLQQMDLSALLAELARIGEHEIDSPEGPIQVGFLEQASTGAGVAQLARHYHAAFRQGLRIFPYFASKRP